MAADDSKDDRACTITLEDGTHYDLTSLASSAKDYDADSGDGGEDFKLNVCRSVVSELWNVDGPENVGGFIKRPDGKGDFSLGDMSTNITLAPGTKEPMLVYEHGSACPSNENEYASTAIRFVCSQSEFGAGTPRLVAALPPGDRACHFFFEWKTHVACAANKRAELESGHVFMFFTLIGIAILTWFGGHTLYNRFYLGRRGAEQFPIPHCSVPKVRLPGTTGDSSNAPSHHTSTSAGSGRPRTGWGWKRRSARGGYSHLPTERDDEEEALAGRFSLADDEDEDEHDDARALGGEVDAWRGHGHDANGRASEEGGGRVGVHQGLVDL